MVNLDMVGLVDASAETCNVCCCELCDAFCEFWPTFYTPEPSNIQEDASKQNLADILELFSGSPPSSKLAIY